MNWFMLALSKYAQFSGRSTRQEYWMFVLFYFLIFIGLSIVDALLGLGILALIFSLGMLIPNLSAGARRLHDTGKSGWWLLIGLVPMVGLVLIYFLAIDSTADNEYGPNPKGSVAPAAA